MLATASAALLWSCGGNADPDPDPTPAAPKTVTLSSTSANVAQTGDEIVLDITAPSRPAISGAPDWISVREGIYNSQTYVMTGVKLTVAANPTYETRTATLTFTAGTASATFQVTQVAAEKPADPDADLTNAKASAAAKKVYAFLKDQAGKKMLSGVQSGGTANNNDRLETIYSMTGKHPALAGYDYIFLQYSPTPEGWSWVVNYDDISAAKEQWEKNGLVSFMWHWNVPSSEAAWKKGKEEYYDTLLQKQRI